MTREYARPVKIFYSYARRDEKFKDELSNHLVRFNISGWHDGKIIAGTDWEVEIKDNLDAADVIFLLISPNFMASDYCYRTEMRLALGKRDRGEAIVIPIILSTVAWENDQLQRSQALPRNAKAVSTWRRRDDAYHNIVEGVRQSIGEMLKQRCAAAARTYFTQEDFEGAYSAYRQALHFATEDVILHKEMGNVCLILKLYREAHDAYSKAIRLEPGNVEFYLKKGEAQSQLEDFVEALSTYEEALKFTKDSSILYESQGDMSLTLGRFDEAVTAYKAAINLNQSHAKLHEKLASAYSSLSIAYREQALKEYNEAIRCEPENSSVKRNKGNILAELGQSEQALEIYDELTNMPSVTPYLYKEMGDALLKLNRLPEALTAYETTLRLLPDFEEARNCIEAVLLRMLQQRDSLSFTLAQRTIQKEKQQEHLERIDEEDLQVN